MITYIEPYTLKPRLWIINILFTLLVVGIIIANNEGNFNSDTNKVFIVMMLALYGIIYFIITRNKISFNEEGITQNSLFIRNRIISWNEIISSKVFLRFGGKNSKFVWETKSTAGKSISFSTSLYSRDELKIFGSSTATKSTSDTSSSDDGRAETFFRQSVHSLSPIFKCRELWLVIVLVEISLRPFRIFFVWLLNGSQQYCTHF